MNSMIRKGSYLIKTQHDKSKNLIGVGVGAVNKIRSNVAGFKLDSSGYSYHLSEGNYANYVWHRPVPICIIILVLVVEFC